MPFLWLAYLSLCLMNLIGRALGKDCALLSHAEKSLSLPTVADKAINGQGKSWMRFSYSRSVLDSPMQWISSMIAYLTFFCHCLMAGSVEDKITLIALGTVIRI